MTIGTVYKPDLVKDPFDAIIIGSGIGGLAAAALLAKEGRKVLVLEQHYVAGGFTHTFKRKGYEWDVGVHYIGEVHRPNSVLRKLFDYISDGQLKWAKMPEVYDKICFPDQIYEYKAGTENFKKSLYDYFPREKKAIDEYVNLVYQMAGAARNFFGAKALPPVMAKVAGPFMSSKFLKLSDRTSREVIESLTKDKKLLGVLTAQYGDYGLPPGESSFAIHAMVAKHYFEGGNYPVGGSSSMAKTIIPVIEKGGGKVLVCANVKEIIVNGGKALGVRLENGDEIYAPLVISDAGVPNTFGKLLEAEVAQKFGFLEKLKQVKPSLAHICLYIGFKQTAKELGLGQANYWIYPDYDHDENIRLYREDPSVSLPVTYASFPSAKDPAWDKNYPGRATMEVIGFTPYNWFTDWENTKWKRRGEDYEAFKQSIADRLLENVYRYVPQVKGKIDYYEISTPLSTKHFANYEHGEIYGIEHTPERFRLRWLKPHTPIKNLYLTGQDIVTDGIGGALFGGVLSASAILRRNLVKDVLTR